ncbi:MAG: asparagine synthase-related protein [Spirosomaceae bacterium]|nr:asparagine synthase-related protein [Spirosomataceae bacterium]
MSGICGIVYFDQRPLDDELARMTQALAHRGAGSINTWQKKHVGLAQLMPFENTQNQLFTAPNDLVAVADARIDSREKNILNLYQKHGQNLLFDLTGDFAFAVWDASRQSLFCGRDHTAARPLYYVFEPYQYFAFASEIKALLVLPFVEKKRNASKIVRYIEWASYLRPYRSETFFEGIYSLPPAQLLSVKADGISSRFCWDLNLGRFAHLKTDQDYLEAFRETFVASVRARTRGVSPVSAHLSGGLDSSSVCVVAHQQLGLPLHTLHFDVGDIAEANERPFAEAVLAQGKYTHEYVPPASDLVESLQKMARIFDRPDHFTLLPTYHLATAAAVQQHGSKVLLTGHDGDSVVGYGRGYPFGLLEKKEWATFKNLMQTYAQMPELVQQLPEWERWTLEKKYQHLLKIYLNPSLKKSLKNKQLGEFLKLFWQYRKHLDAKLWPSFENIFEKLSDFIKTPSSKRLFVTETDYGFDSTHNALIADMLHEGMLESTEEFEHLAAHHGHEAAHPFYDKHLMELCMVIPDRFKFDNGYRRGPLRHAMRGLLPDPVRLRMTKVVMTQPIVQPLRAEQKALREILHEATHKLPHYFDEQTVQYFHQKFEHAARLIGQPDFNRPSEVIRSIHLAVWLL